MRSRFIRWAILLGVFLALCSGAGVAVNQTIQPKERDYRSYYATRPPTYTTYDTSATVTTVAQQSVPQVFQPTRAPLPNEVSTYSKFLQQLQIAHADLRNGNNATFIDLCDTDRMAREWVVFGVYYQRGRVASSVDFVRDSTGILNGIVERLKADKQTFCNSKIRVQWVSNSSTGNDVMLLVRHNTTGAGSTTTWYTRWWLTRDASGWKLYDYEEQPHRLRVNAILASESLDSSATRDVIRRTTSMFENGETKYSSEGSNTMRKLIPPLEAMRKAMHHVESPDRNTDLARKLQNDQKVWPDTPALALMLASEKLDAASLKSFSIYGSHPWATVLEATILRAAKDDTKARRVLETALKENTGHPLLLNALYNLLPGSDISTLGTQAATGATPSKAIRKLFAEHCRDQEAMSGILKAFRATLPEDTEGLLAQAVLDADRGDFASARKMIESLMAGIPSAQYAEWTQRFLDLYTNKLGNSKSVVIDNPILGPLLKN